MCNRVELALDHLAEEAGVAWLSVVYGKLSSMRDAVADKTIDATETIAWLYAQIAAIEASGALRVPETFGAAHRAIGLYRRAIGALQERWCSECGRPTEGEHERNSRPLCDGCHYSNVVI